MAGSPLGVEFRDLDLRWPGVAAAWALASAPHFIKLHSTSISITPCSCPSKQSGKTKTAVHVSSFSCSHSSAMLQFPGGHQIFRRML